MAISLHTTDSRGFADLHMHTKFSDGDLSVDELIRLSKKKGLRCISITDHDNLDSYNAALEPAKEVGIEIIPGIENSKVYNVRKTGDFESVREDILNIKNDAISTKCIIFLYPPSNLDKFYKLLYNIIIAKYGLK